MANKRKHTKKRDPNQIIADEKPSDDDVVGLQDAVLHPALQAMLTLIKYNNACGECDLDGLSESLFKQTQAISKGNLKRGAEMLAAQAHTLDAIFNNLAQRAALNMGEYMQACDTYLKLALRAQSQCRATLEALSAIQNPPMGYIGQANIAHGPQQVNNAPAKAGGVPRTRENPDPKSKLLEEKDGERLDTGATGAAGRADPAMATLGEVDWAEDAGG